MQRRVPSSTFQKLSLNVAGSVKEKHPEELGISASRFHFAVVI
jgi:hypothetical protein